MTSDSVATVGPVRWRGVEIAGALAVAGVLVLLALTFWPESQTSTTVTTSTSGQSILSPPLESPAPSATQTPEPTETVEETPEENQSSRPADISPERRAQIAVQVLNAGAEDGAATLATGALAEQSFQPRDPADAVAASQGTLVLHAENRRRAALTVGRIVGAEPGQVVRATADDPNWAAFGGDLDVLVVIGPPIL